MTNFKLDSLKNKRIEAELVVPPDTIAFNIPFLQRISDFVSSLSPCLLRKGELKFEVLTEPIEVVPIKKYRTEVLKL